MKSIFPPGVTRADFSEDGTLALTYSGGASETLDMTERTDLSDEDREYLEFKEAVLGRDAGGPVVQDGQHSTSAWANEPGEAVREEEELKDSLIEDHRREHHEAEDPSDGLADDELWERTPKTWRKDG